MKQKTSFTLSSEARSLLAALVAADGTNMTAELELAIRERAEARGLCGDALERAVRALAQADPAAFAALIERCISEEKTNHVQD